MSGNLDSAEVKRTHKVRVGNNLLNEYEDNPELIGGVFARLFPLDLTKDAFTTNLATSIQCTMSGLSRTEANVLV